MAFALGYAAPTSLAALPFPRANDGGARIRRCPTWMYAADYPTDPSSSTARFKFVYGSDTLDEMGHRIPCSVTSNALDTSSFTFTVNGVNERSYFTMYKDSAVAN